MIRRTAIKEILQRFPLDRHPFFQSGNRIISGSQFSSFHSSKPFAEMLEGIWLLLHAVDDEGGFRKGNPRPLRAKGSWFFRRLAHYSIRDKGRRYLNTNARANFLCPFLNKNVKPLKHRDQRLFLSLNLSRIVYGVPRIRQPEFEQAPPNPQCVPPVLPAQCPYGVAGIFSGGFDGRGKAFKTSASISHWFKPLCPARQSRPRRTTIKS